MLIIELKIISDEEIEKKIGRLDKAYFPPTIGNFEEYIKRVISILRESQLETDIKAMENMVEITQEEAKYIEHNLDFMKCGEQLYDSLMFKLKPIAEKR
jgi:hypothetical protein